MIYLLFIIQAFAFQNLPSSIAGTELGNAHLVAQGKSKIIRGAQPLGKENELKKLGVRQVLIFKNQTQSEVDRQKSNLLKLGYTEQQIIHIPFKWKEFESQKKQCQMIISGLKVLRQAYLSPHKTTYLHCTVGEDRTGVLSALFRRLVTQESTSEVFENEMCQRGYEAGNTKKPYSVVHSIRRELTPLFLKLAHLIDENQLNLNNLSSSVCDQIETIAVDSKSWKCR
jgi:hypothetical protein